MTDTAKKPRKKKLEPEPPVEMPQGVSSDMLAKLREIFGGSENGNC